MAELTPIPAEQRRAYYDALLAGRDEAERLGYGLADDRIFMAFHRALYRPMLDAHEAEVRAKVAEEIETAFRHWEHGATTRPRVERGGFLNDRDWCLAIIRGSASARPEDPSHGNSADTSGEQQTDGTNKAPESPVEPRTGVATPNGTNATPQTAQTV